VQIKDKILVNFVEYLVEISLQDILEPLDQIPPSNLSSPRTSHSPTLEPKLNKKDCEILQLLAHQMTRNQPYMPSCMSQGAHNLRGKFHNFPKNPERISPNFHPNKSCAPKDHIKNIYLNVRIMKIENEDVVCRLFPYTFKNKASTWCYSFLVGSITG
jgi:hypothetical protein